MKRITVLFLSFLLLFCGVACTDSGETDGGKVVIKAQSRENYAAENMMDLDLSKGWIGTKKANETVPQIVEIDLGNRRTISKITIDDTFKDGFTNPKPAYLMQNVTYNRGDSSSLAEGASIPFILNGSADGQGWKSQEVPMEDAPQWLYFSLRKSCEVTKLIFNNEMNNSVSVSFSVYYSSSPLASDADASDSSNYTLLADITDNTENIKEIVLTESVLINNMLIVFRSQLNEGKPVIASLDEIFFYAPAGDDYSEPHQPVRFYIMGSDDGIIYETFVEESGNYNEVWIKQLEKNVTYRYIKYLLFEEYNNNYPSIGEIKFE